MGQNYLFEKISDTEMKITKTEMEQGILEPGKQRVIPIHSRDLDEGFVVWGTRGVIYYEGIFETEKEAFKKMEKTFNNIVKFEEMWEEDIAEVACTHQGAVLETSNTSVRMGITHIKL